MCWRKLRSKRQAARQRHNSFFLVTQRACSQATLSETAKEVVKRGRQGGHLATSVAASVVVILKAIREIFNAEFESRIYIKYLPFKRAGL